MSTNNYRFLETIWLLVFTTIIALMVWALTGCAPTPCVKPIISIVRPDLPTITAQELDSLAAETYQRVATRDRLLHNYAMDLEIIVRELAEVPE